MAACPKCGHIVVEAGGIHICPVDSVNHPSYYNSGKIEVIDFIEDQKLGFHLGTVVKYISRAGKKDSNKLVEDLEKARWYLTREIERLKQ